MNCVETIVPDCFSKARKRNFKKSFVEGVIVLLIVNPSNTKKLYSTLVVLAETFLPRFIHFINKTGKQNKTLLSVLFFNLICQVMIQTIFQTESSLCFSLFMTVCLLPQLLCSFNKINEKTTSIFCVWESNILFPDPSKKNQSEIIVTTFEKQIILSLPRNKFSFVGTLYSRFMTGTALYMGAGGA